MITTTVVIAASVSYNDDEGVRLSPKGDNMKKLSVDPDNFLHDSLHNDHSGFHDRNHAYDCGTTSQLPFHNPNHDS